VASSELKDCHEVLRTAVRCMPYRTYILPNRGLYIAGCAIYASVRAYIAGPLLSGRLSMPALITLKQGAGINKFQIIITIKFA